MIKTKPRKLERGEFQIKDENTYLLTFPNSKARIEGKEAMSEVGGVRQGVLIEGQHVSAVWGFQVKELDRLKIPYRIFGIESKNNNNHNETALRK